MMYGIGAERNRRKCRVRNSHCHVTTLPMAIPEAAFSAFRCVLWLNETFYSKRVWRSE